MDSLILNIKKYREKPITILFIIALISVIYGVAFKIIENEQIFIKYKLIIYFISYIIGIIIWAFATKRLVLPSHKFTVFIYANFDEEKAENELRKLVDESIKEIKSKHNFIRIIRKPFNICNDKTELIDKLNRMIIKPDLAWLATIKSGKETYAGQTSYKIDIKKFDILCNFPPDSNYKLNNTTINFKNDLTIRNLDKDWVYFENNSYKDKEKLKVNFIDNILYSIGIFLIYSFKWENSCDVLKQLYKPILIKISSKEVQKIPINSTLFAGMRLSNILMNLLTSLSYKEFAKYEYNKAYQLVLECERLFPNSFQEPGRYELLAMLAYLCGEFDNSVKYTNILANIQGNKFTVYINCGFYAILNNSIKDLYENYEKIINYKNKSDFNAVDVVGFLEDQRGKEKLKGKDALIDFAEAILTKLFINTEDGNKQLDDFMLNNEHSQEYISLCKLCQKVRDIKDSAGTNNKIYKKKKRKRR